MNRKILFQVTAPTVLAGLLLLGGCAVSFWSIEQLQDNLARIQSDTLPSLEASQDLEIKLRQLRHHTFLYLIDPTPSRLDPIREDDEGFVQDLAEARRSARTRKRLACRAADRRTAFSTIKQDMATLRQEVARNGPRTDFQNLVGHAPHHAPGRALPRPLAAKQGEAEAQCRRERPRQRAGSVDDAGAGAGRHGGRLAVRLRPGARPDAVDRPAERCASRTRCNDCDGPAATLPSPNVGAVIEVGSVTLTADDDLGRLDERLTHVVRRVEEVTERLRRQHARDAAGGANVRGGPAGRQRGPRGAQPADRHEAAGGGRPASRRGAAAAHRRGPPRDSRRDRAPGRDGAELPVVRPAAGPEARPHADLRGT